MICNSCGRSFDEPKVEYEHHSELEVFQDEPYYICPYCESDEIEKSDECSICGNQKPTTDDFCKFCDAAIAERVKTSLSEFQAEFSCSREKAIEAFNYVLEGLI